MAFSSDGALGTNNSKTSGTTLVITTTQVAQVGRVIAVKVAWDDVDDDIDGDTTLLSVADSAGNTYTRAKEFNNSQFTGADGATVGIFYAVVTTELASGGTITITGPTRTAKAATAWKFSKGAGTTLEIEDTNGEFSTGDLAAITLTGMTSREYLLLWAAAVESTAVTYTQDGDYTSTGTDGTTGGGVASNMSIGGGFRIATLTEDTVDAGTDPDGDYAQAFVAIFETGGGSTITPPSVVHNRAIPGPSVIRYIVASAIVHTRAFGTAIIVPGAVVIAQASVVHTRAFGTPVVGGQQKLLPDADSVDGAWTTDTGGTTLFAAIDEATFSDADYIQSEATPANSSCRVSLASGANPLTDESHRIRVRVAKDSTGGGNIDMRVQLRQGGGGSIGGGTLIAERTMTNISTSFTTFDFDLDTTEADDITDYTDLFLEFRANQTA